MRNKNFLIILIGQIISLLGNAIQRFSMSLYLLEFTGSTVAFANILAISIIPYILFAPIAGWLSDNVNRKKIMVVLDVICSIIIGLYSIILFQGRDHEVIVGIVMFILSICATIYSPAVSASIPQIVEEEKLTSANGIINQVGSIVNVAGPILAGVIYGFFGIKAIVIINAISFLFSAIMEMFLVIPDVKKREKFAISINLLRNSFIDMGKSFSYLKKNKKIILGIIISYALGNISLVPILSIIAPYFINIKLGLSSQIYGIVEAICVCGMIIGGFWISVKPNMFIMKKVHYTYFPMIFGVLIMCILVFLNLNAYLMAGIFAVGGMFIMLSLALSNVLTLTFIQKEVPSEMLGRVSAFSVAVATISVPPGQILYGQLIENLSLSIIFIITTILNIALVFFVKWNVRNLE